MQKEDLSNQDLLNPVNQMQAENEHNLQQTSNNANSKQAQTTQLTKSNFPKFLIPGSSFEFGHNTVVQKGKIHRVQTADREQDSDAESQHSDVSFEEKLKFQHVGPMRSSIATFLEKSNQINDKQVFLKNLNNEHKNALLTIETECLKNIELNYGKLELQRMKNIIRFLNRNEQLLQVYEQILPMFPQQMRLSLYFLLKQSLTLYLQVKQNIKKINQKKFNKESVEEYIDQHFGDIMKRFRSCQKISILTLKKQSGNKSSQQNLQKTLQDFLKTWIQSIILCAQGYPQSRYCDSAKILHRMRSVDSSSSDENQSYNSQNEVKKKIKKW